MVNFSQTLDKIMIMWYNIIKKDREKGTPNRIARKPEQEPRHKAGQGNRQPGPETDRTRAARGTGNPPEETKPAGSQETILRGGETAKRLAE